MLDEIEDLEEREEQKQEWGLYSFIELILTDRPIDIDEESRVVNECVTEMMENQTADESSEGLTTNDCIMTEETRTHSKPNLIRKHFTIEGLTELRNRNNILKAEVNLELQKLEFEERQLNLLIRSHETWSGYIDNLKNGINVTEIIALSNIIAQFPLHF